MSLEKYDYYVLSFFEICAAWSQITFRDPLLIDFQAQTSQRTAITLRQPHTPL